MPKSTAARTVAVGAILATVLAQTASAQVLLGTAAASCLTLPASRLHTLTVTTPVARGNSVIIAAALDSGAATDISVSDSKGNNYPGVVGRLGHGIAATSVLLRAPLQNALALGDTITLRYGAANAGQNSCVGIYGFSQLAASSQVLDTAGSADGRAATTLAVSGIGDSRSQPNLVFAAFATTGSVGAVTAGAPATALPSVCAASGSVCLVTAYRAANAAGPQTISLGTTTARDWSGVLAALYADSIFFNGFD